MTVLKNFVENSGNYENIVHTCKYVLDIFKIKNTISNVDNLTKNHFEFPSILSIVDSLKDYGVESAAVRKGKYKFTDFETPFICTIQKPEWSEYYFTAVSKIEDGNVHYFDPIKKNKQILTLAEFSKIDKDIILLLDAKYGIDEVKFKENEKREKIHKFKKWLPFILLGLSVIFSSIFSFLSYPLTYSVISIVFLICNIIGAVISMLIIWHGFDAHNPFLKEVCSGNRKNISCKNVLTSKGSKFFGINWSLIGFSYFTTFLLSQILFGLANPQYLSYYVLFPLLVAPYIIYSIYYQWKIIAQWCTLCLIIQVVLLVSGIHSIFALSYINILNLPLYSLFTLILIAIIVLTISYTLSFLVEKVKESYEFKKRWEHLKYDFDIFNILLKKEASIISTPPGLGLLIGDPKASYEIIKVCNPYCGPCSQAHPHLEELLHLNPNVKIRIIFTSTGKEDDMKTAAVQHFLSIQQNHGNEVLINALNYWYSVETKDYAEFAEKFPIHSALNEQEKQVDDMRVWCELMKIRATPTFFINGYELPNSYRIKELKYILRSN